uniref:acyl-CoA dehydrogenase family protein n=1 Tax=Nocardia brasiliensis TaxID=37326 RepID=UPI003D7A9940
AVQLESTRDYAKQRKVFGQPLTANQYLQYTYAELAARADMLRVIPRVLGLPLNIGHGTLTRLGARPELPP